MGTGRPGPITRSSTVKARRPASPRPPPPGCPSSTAGTPLRGVGGHVPAVLAAVAAALGPTLRARVSTVALLPTGLTALIPGGPQLRFGDATHLAEKAQAAAGVLGALVSPATYIDVSVPSAPVAG